MFAFYLTSIRGSDDRQRTANRSRSGNLKLDRSGTQDRLECTDIECVGTYLQLVRSRKGADGEAYQHSQNFEVLSVIDTGNDGRRFIGKCVAALVWRLEPFLDSAGVVHSSGLQKPSRRLDRHWAGWPVQGCGPLGEIGIGGNRIRVLPAGIHL